MKRVIEPDALLQLECSNSSNRLFFLKKIPVLTKLESIQQCLYSEVTGIKFQGV